MTKSEFIDSASSYYAVAIAISVRNTDSATIGAIRRRFTNDDQDEPYYEYLAKGALLERGIEIAQNLGLIVVIRDTFGPDIIKKAGDYFGAWDEAISNEYAPFSKFALAGDDGHDWLRRALISINTKFDELEIKDTNFIEESRDEWSPIPLDRHDEELEQLTEAVDATIEGLRKDNGYGATYTEEKIYVLEKLSAANRRLKEDAQISWMYLKNFAVDPLVLLVRRFGGAAIGLLASSAVEALKIWLRKKGIAVLDDIFR